MALLSLYDAILSEYFPMLAIRLAVAVIPREEAGQLEAESGKNLADIVALNIGQLGENMVLGDVNYFIASQGKTIFDGKRPVLLA